MALLNASSSYSSTVARDLPLTRPQRVVLAGLHAVSLVLPTLASQAASAVVSSMKCPFDDPPTDIKGAYGPNKNMYLCCLHWPQHCWDFNGKFITCP